MYVSFPLMVKVTIEGNINVDIVTRYMYIEHILPGHEGYSTCLLHPGDCELPESHAISLGLRPQEIACNSGNSQSRGGNKRVL